MRGVESDDINAKLLQYNLTSACFASLIQYGVQVLNLNLSQDCM